MTENEAATKDVQRAVARLSRASGQQIFTCCMASLHPEGSEAWEPCVLFSIRIEDGEKIAKIGRIADAPAEDVVVLTGFPE